MTLGSTTLSSIDPECHSRALTATLTLDLTLMWIWPQLDSSADGGEAEEQGEAGDEMGEGAFFLPRALRRDLEASGCASTSSRR